MAVALNNTHVEIIRWEIYSNFYNYSQVHEGKDKHLIRDIKIYKTMEVPRLKNAFTHKIKF